MLCVIYQMSNISENRLKQNSRNGESRKTIRVGEFNEY